MKLELTAQQLQDLDRALTQAIDVVEVAIDADDADPTSTCLPQAWLELRKLILKEEGKGGDPLPNLTDEQRRRHLLSGGENCPFCGGDIEGGFVEIQVIYAPEGSRESNVGSAYQKCGCLECHREWENTYNLASVTVIRERSHND